MPDPAPPRRQYPSTLSPSQWTTLYAVSSVVIPSLPPSTLSASAPAAADEAAITRFSRDAADYDNVPFRRGLEGFMALQLVAGKRKGIRVVLDMLK